MPAPPWRKLRRGCRFGNVRTQIPSALRVVWPNWHFRHHAGIQAPAERGDCAGEIMRKPRGGDSVSTTASLDAELSPAPSIFGTVREPAIPLKQDVHLRPPTSRGEARHWTELHRRRSRRTGEQQIVGKRPERPPVHNAGPSRGRRPHRRDRGFQDQAGQRDQHDHPQHGEAAEPEGSAEVRTRSG